MVPGWPNPHKSVDEIRSDQARLREYARGFRGFGQNLEHLGAAIGRMFRGMRRSISTRLRRGARPGEQPRHE